MSGLFTRVLVAAALASVCSGAAVAADPAAGKSVFQSTCGICHSVQPGANKIGPTLFGVVGRKTGSVPGYTYSPQNQGANLTWDPATLDKYLEAPRTMIPGTKMTYAGLKDPAKRADLIAYLETLK
jgi:cytochrome c